MTPRQVVVVLGATVLLVAALGGAAVVGQQVLATHSHSYVYRVAVETETNLTDVTVYAPLPTREGQTLTDAYDGATVVRHPQSVWVPDEDPRAPRDTGGSADWTVSVVETGAGPMLALRATDVEAGTYVFGANTQYEPGRIDTADPWRSAFVLNPAGDVTAVECPSRADETERCYTYDTRLFADYDAPSDADGDAAVVTVSASLHGQSDWTFAMANGWNWFDQQSVATLDGRPDGWLDTEGTLDGGAGTYP